MINIFDLSAGIAGTMMLTERAQRDGSPVRRGRNDAVNKFSDPVIAVQDKPVTRESRSSSDKKSSGTPMKMLIEQEMSKEMEAKQKTPGVIAKLMGLDALPAQETSGSISLCSPQEGRLHTWDTNRGVARDRRRENSFLERMVAREVKPIPSYAEGNRDCKDVYEVCHQQPSRPGHVKDEPFLRGRCRDNCSDSRMALVRQKFIEAKRLATNQKLLQSKEFQDALEVLSSNKDLFLKFLEEPNSLFSKCLHETRAVPLPTQTKRITVLKPSKSLGIGVERRTKSCVPELETNDQDRDLPGWGSTFLHKRTESLSQPTRIVVLKPSPGGKTTARNTSATSSTASMRNPLGEDSFEHVEADVGNDSREVAKEITRQMRESFSSRRDETLLSAALSNGYIGDESSIYRSDDENMDDVCDNFSDLEMVTPASRHSWDCVNRFDSPYSISSISRASFSPESSVIREAKKRLSERLVMLSSTETSQEQRQVRRSTSTLGEMLALTETKKDEDSMESNTLGTILRGGSFGGDQDRNAPIPRVCGNESDDEIVEEQAPTSLQRSRSVPLSCLTYSVAESETDDSDLQTRKPDAPVDKKKTGKSSFKEKVSSFLFARNKKFSLEKSLPPPMVVPPLRIQSCAGGSDASGSNPVEGPLHVESETPAFPFITYDQDGNRVENEAAKMYPVNEKYKIADNACDNLAWPSPPSILELNYENIIDRGALRTREMSLNTDCSRAISRSTPIESIARSLHWNGAHVEKVVSNPSRQSSNILKADIEEHERVTFVETVLSSAGLANETPSTAFARWHSLESPLNPTLLEKFLERKEEGAKCRERRSKQRLLFDCINTILLEIRWNKAIDGCTYSAYHFCFHEGAPSANSVTEEVLKRLRDWFSSVENMAFRCSENGSHIVDYIVRNEVGGNGWAEFARSEIGELGKEIEGHILEELVGEALDDFIVGCTPH